MFRPVIISVLLASVVSIVRCGTVPASSIVGNLVPEGVVESHGSNVVHASAPLVAAAAAAPPALLKYANVAEVQQQPAAVAVGKADYGLVAEKTIEAHGHQIVHDAQPLVALAKPLAAVDAEPHFAVPAIAAREILPYASPIYYSAAYPYQLVAEKTVSSYGHSIRHV